MKELYHFDYKCPSSADYEIYLNNTGTPEFLLAFNLHLKKCKLCTEAVEGYKSMQITDIRSATQQVSQKLLPKTRSIVNAQVLAYAASVAILLGIASFILFGKSKENLAQHDTAFDYSMLENNGPNINKTLAPKSSEQFIYIGSCDKIAYNDQFLSPSELEKKLKAQKNVSSITIEVGTNNYECANQIINNIKKDQSAPVITFSKTGGIKKLTSWEGM